MDQVAHQAVVMQFILEMASNSQQDPRGCFRQFFHKAKVRFHIQLTPHMKPRRHRSAPDIIASAVAVVQDGQDVYLEVFHTELEAFKHRVREHTARSRGDSIEQQNLGTNCRREPKNTVDSLPQPQVSGAGIQTAAVTPHGCKVAPLSCISSALRSGTH